jgi:predicted HNH restriction endonuclease
VSDRIPEKALVMPSLLIMSKKGHTKTSELIKELPIILNVEGDDLTILDGRKDNKFSQKVRNLKSHNTFEEKGFAKYNKTEKRFEITKKGIKALNDNKDSLMYLIGNNFNIMDSLNGLGFLTDNQERMEVFEEGVLITEGCSEYVLSKKIKRSSRLRKMAIEYYQGDQGSISCNICSFNFEDTYGGPAKGYIEMHHLVPVYMYEGEDLQKTIEGAIKNLLPVCANCHRVIHRTSPPYKIKDVRGFYKNHIS